MRPVRLTWVCGWTTGTMIHAIRLKPAPVAIHAGIVSVRMMHMDGRCWMISCRQRCVKVFIMRMDRYSMKSMCTDRFCRAGCIIRVYAAAIAMICTARRC